MKSNIIIIGAGASGLMCAAQAGKRGRSVIVLDHAKRSGQKILVSGGGSCNFTNRDIHSGNYISENPHFCKSALARFRPSDFIALLKKHRISYHEKQEGQLFCKGSSLQITDMLKKECSAVGAKIYLGCSIHEIFKDSGFRAKTSLGVFESESTVIATGGLSYPNLGASDLGLRIAGHFGINVIPPRPSLVPLILSPADQKKFSALAGVSFDAEAGTGLHKFRGKILFTHKGLSGPAVLQVSSYWEPGQGITIDLLPGHDAKSIFAAGRQSRTAMKNLLSKYLPRRLAQTWAEFYLPLKPVNQYNEKELLEAAGLVHSWTLYPSGTEGFRTAEVTRGGVDTSELSSKTMEAKKVPGLYFIGEAVDVTGQLGGYNLHWAWASGWAAGQYA